MPIRHERAGNFPELPQFIPAYSAEAWQALDRNSEHETVLILDNYTGDILRKGPMAVLLMTDMELGARSVIDLYIADDDNAAVNRLLDYVS